MSVHTFDAMGTTVSIRIPDAVATAGQAGSGIAQAREAFDALDATFSLYRPDSELSRIARGELLLSDASASVTGTYAAALEWRARTHDAFTPHRPDGVIDLSGIVKALAIAAAAAALGRFGITVFSVNAGGDLLSGGTPNRGHWATGILDPWDRARQLTSVRLDPELPALATSGTSERGAHIWSRRGSPGDIVQASVIASDIVSADVLATAIVSGGSASLDEVTASHPVGVLAVFRDGTLAANAILRGRLGGGP